jgi:hypothetical protein
VLKSFEPVIQGLGLVRTAQHLAPKSDRCFSLALLRHESASSLLERAYLRAIKGGQVEGSCDRSVCPAPE